MRIKEFMSQPVTVVGTDTTLEEVARLMLEKNIGALPVVDEAGQLTGIITESDFAAKSGTLPFSRFRAPKLFHQWIGQEDIQKLYAAARQLKASEIMQRHVHTLSEEQPVEKAVELMLEHDVNRLPVVRAGIPVGIVSRHDLLRLVVSQLKSAAG
jgi:CBS domain-containing protein